MNGGPCLGDVQPAGRATRTGPLVVRDSNGMRTVPGTGPGTRDLLPKVSWVGGAHYSRADATNGNVDGHKQENFSSFTGGEFGPYAKVGVGYAR